MHHDMNYITFHCKYGQMSIHRGCILYLQKPSHIQILVNSTTKEVLIKPSNQYERDSFLVPSTIYERKAAFGLNGPDYLDKIMKLMDWPNNNAYRIRGVNHEGTILFPLQSAVALNDWQETLITADDA